jgi:hypothetical protein
MRFGWMVLLAACSGDKETGDTAVPLVGPVLTHTPPVGATEGVAIDVEVTATDAEGVEEVTLFHRVAGETTWVQTPMAPGEGDAWVATLASTDVDDPEVEYYFRAMDGGDVPATSYLPAESTSDPYLLPVSVIGTPLPFVEDFEHESDQSITDLGWSNASISFRGYAWETNTAQAYDGTRSAYHARGHSEASAMEDWLLSPALDFSGVPSAQVTWREYGQAVDNADHGLWVSTSSRDPNDGTYVAVAEVLPFAPDGEWGRSAVYDLSAYAGQSTVYLAWRFVGQNADDWYIDDVEVRELTADLVLDVSVAPSPIGPGDAGVVTVDVTNLGTVDATGLTATVTFPEGGATSAGSGAVSDVSAGGTGSGGVDITIDAATPDNSYVAYAVELTDGTTTWTAEGDLTVGYASTATFTFDPSDVADVDVIIGVGDPASPTWSYEETLSSVAGEPVSIVLDVTDQYTLLPPAAGDLRWFAYVDPEIAGTVDDFSISYGGETFTASVLPTIVPGGDTVWLPEPPDFSATATTTPSTVTPGDVGVWIDLSLTNDGADTQGPLTATLSTDDPDATVITGGPVAYTSGVFEGGDTVTQPAIFQFDVAATHTDSSPIVFDLTLDDGVESWVVPVNVAVPWAALEITRIEIDDDGRDGIIDSGEEAELTFQLTNIGDLPTEGRVYGTLTAESSSTATVTVDTNEESWSQLASGRSDTQDDPFTVNVSGAEGDTIDLLLTLNDDVNTYSARTTLRIGEPPFQSLDSSGDPVGDSLGGDFDFVGGSYRVDGDILQILLESDTAFDPERLFIEAWGYSTIADWTYYRIVIQPGDNQVQGYNSGFTDISVPVVTYPSATEVQIDVTLADLGLAVDSIELGFATGWCGPPEYYCDHFPDGWGYPYDSWSPGLFYSLSW